jgi:hypothetical protein
MPSTPGAPRISLGRHPARVEQRASDAASGRPPLPDTSSWPLARAYPTDLAIAAPISPWASLLEPEDAEPEYWLAIERRHARAARLVREQVGR